MTDLIMHGCTDVGQRSQNEDCFLVDADLALAVVADGMGGHASGDVASRMVVDIVRAEVAAGQSLEMALEQSHVAVLGAARGNDSARMGAAVVTARFTGAEYQVCWVGDCRAYLWSGELVQLTRDHSYVETLLSTGKISWEEAQNRPDRNLITQAIGGSEDIQVDVCCVRGTLSPGEELLLCSDGLNDVLRGREIAEILAGSGDLQDRCQQLVDTAKAAGGRDNITALLVTGAGTPLEIPAAEPGSLHPPPVSISRLDGSVDYFTASGDKLTANAASSALDLTTPDPDVTAVRAAAAPVQPRAPVRQAGRFSAARGYRTLPSFGRSLVVGLGLGGLLVVSVLLGRWLLGV